MMRAFVLSLVATAALSLSAGAEGLRPDDVKLSASELHDRIAGKSLKFYDGSEARYSKTGDYTYRYNPQDPAIGGAFETSDDSRVCVTFSNGYQRCDTYVVNSGRLVLINKDGLRYPVETMTDLD